MALTNKIGVIADSFRVGVREGLSKAKLAGADGVQIYAVSGEMDPANLTSEARKELKDYIASIGLEISALCGDLGGHGFQDKNVNREKKSKKNPNAFSTLPLSSVQTWLLRISESFPGIRTIPFMRQCRMPARNSHRMRPE